MSLTVCVCLSLCLSLSFSLFPIFHSLKTKGSGQNPHDQTAGFRVKIPALPVSSSVPSGESLFSMSQFPPVQNAQ